MHTALNKFVHTHSVCYISGGLHPNKTVKLSNGVCKITENVNMRNWFILIENEFILIGMAEWYGIQIQTHVEIRFVTVSLIVWETNGKLTHTQRRKTFWNRNMVMNSDIKIIKLQKDKIKSNRIWNHKYMCSIQASTFMHTRTRHNEKSENEISIGVIRFGVHS